MLQSANITPDAANKNATIDNSTIRLSTTTKKSLNNIFKNFELNTFENYVFTNNNG